MKTPSTKYIKKTTQDTIIRINLDNGNFAIISNKVMNDENISSDAFRLLTIMLNKADSWEIQVGYIGRQLKWDSRRVTKAVTNLEENGYLTKVGKSLGSKGFEYTYTVSEFGNLKTSSIEVEPTPAIEEISQPESPKLVNNTIKLLLGYIDSLVDSGSLSKINTTDLYHMVNTSEVVSIDEIDEIRSNYF